MVLKSEKYVLFTTFRRDGRAVSTPVWLVELPEGRFGFSTGSDSGKAKRLRHTARVTLQACDRSGGSPHGPVLDGQARLVSGSELSQIRSAIKSKYGAMATAFAVAATVARRLGGSRANAGSRRRGHQPEHRLGGCRLSALLGRRTAMAAMSTFRRNVVPALRSSETGGCGHQITFVAPTATSAFAARSLSAAI